TSVPGTSFDSAAGMGPANSPAENEMIAELVAPTVAATPAAFPKWNSLLLGPALRGTEVTVG
ncbi:MAG TPA: ABC transporter substrate-binding protein, partial [Pseudonocardiaceae bacterium]|nr:ABC transporter substrate-binding protein [Pseudonocardiaceae bacterium]